METLYVVWGIEMKLFNSFMLLWNVIGARFLSSVKKDFLLSTYFFPLIYS